ncbi:MAG: hypothetical protein FJW39_19915 [Acidobacteria bacterium]|nr:hypothetical protein [Acidobacteriota bacterium]
MKKTALVLALSMTAFGATWTGYLVDAKCNKAHANDKGKGCASKCITGGQAVKLVVGEDVLDIAEASQAAAKAYVEGAKDAKSLKVTVNGKQNKKTKAIVIAKKKGIAAAD